MQDDALKQLSGQSLLTSATTPAGRQPAWGGEMPPREVSRACSKPQSHPHANPEPPTSHLQAYRKPPPCDPRATPKPGTEPGHMELRWCHKVPVPGPFSAIRPSLSRFMRKVLGLKRFCIPHCYFCLFLRFLLATESQLPYSCRGETETAACIRGSRGPLCRARDLPTEPGEGGGGCLHQTSYHRARLTDRLRELGFCEQQRIRLLTRQSNFICQVCNARLAISKKLADSIMVEAVPAAVPRA